MEIITWVIILIFAGQIIGSLFGLIFRPSKKILHASLAFAGSLMILVSLFKLIPESNKILNSYLVLIPLFLGFIIMFIVDKTLPHINPQLSKKEKPSVKRSVSMLIIGMALHNIPEGLALGSGLALSFSLGLSIAIVLALHDIPENIATIIPLYSLNRKRLKSFLITTSTILFELVGFLFAFFIPFSHKLIGILLASAAGFMLYISTEELLPNSNFKEYPRAVLVSILLSIIIFLVIIFSTLLM